MVTVRLIERRGAVLTPSGLACLAGVPTVNLSCGCAHDCLYCYARGYAQYPGEGTVHVYRDTAERVAGELKRKRRRPRTVYFSPSCDTFQPVEELLEQAYQTMRVLLEAGVGVEFVTKGTVPSRFLDLFRNHRGRVSGQVGLTTLDERLRATLEPGAAPVEERLATMTHLKEAGVEVSARADPMICGVTDAEEDLAALLDACKTRGVTAMAASYLFLRPAITASLNRRIADRALLDKVLTPYVAGSRFALRGGAGGGRNLPQPIRAAGYERVARLGTERGVTIHVCGCKNPDVATGQCHLVRPQAVAGLL